MKVDLNSVIGLAVSVVVSWLAWRIGVYELEKRNEEDEDEKA